MVHHAVDYLSGRYKMLFIWASASGGSECEAESARLGLTEPEGFGETRVERTRPMHSHEMLTFETTVSKVSLSGPKGKIVYAV